MAITQTDAGVGDGGGFGTVGSHHDGGSELLRGLADELENRVTAGGVEVAGGFVGDQD